MTAAQTPQRARNRRCIVTGEVRPAEQLVRFAVDPDGHVVPDVAGRLPGRGLWLLPRRDIIHKACERNQFARAARRPVSLYPASVYPANPASGPSALPGKPVPGRPVPGGPVPGEALSEVVEAQLVRRCADLIGLARRAGRVVMGFEQVQAWLRGLATHHHGVLTQARDGAAGSCDRLARLANAVPAEVARIDVLSAAELGRAFGRDRVVHVGLAPDAGLAQVFVTEANRLAGLRPASERGRGEFLGAMEGVGGGDG